MKKCMVMFVFFILMLALAVFVENTSQIASEETRVMDQSQNSSKGEFQN